MEKKECVVIKQFYLIVSANWKIVELVFHRKPKPVVNFAIVAACSEPWSMTRPENEAQQPRSLEHK